MIIFKKLKFPKDGTYSENPSDTSYFQSIPNLGG